MFTLCFTTETTLEQNNIHMWIIDIEQNIGTFPTEEGHKVHFKMYYKCTQLQVQLSLLLKTNKVGLALTPYL